MNIALVRGPTLLEHLETVELDQSRMLDRPFRMPVQWVNRPNLDFRGFSGQIASGRIKPGDAVRILPGSTASVVQVASSPWTATCRRPAPANR
jgi:bifunctional enzyme CysN/CysC